MRTEKEIRKKLKEHTRIMNGKIRKANKAGSDATPFFEAGAYIIGLAALAWVLEDEVLKGRKKVK